MVGANSLLLLNDDAHLEQRRLLMPMFRGSHLASYADTMTAIAASEIKRWPRGKPLRLHPRMQALTLELILRAAFGFAEGERLIRLRAELVRLLTIGSGLLGQVLMVTVSPRMTAGLAHKMFRGVDRLLYAEIDDRRKSRQPSRAPRRAVDAAAGST